MLTPGNRKLGADLVWGFGLPSGDPAVCVGTTAVCRRHCYAVRTEQYRRHAAAESAANLTLAGRPDFARRPATAAACAGGGCPSHRAGTRWRSSPPTRPKGGGDRRVPRPPN